jgi:hypothetical protein
VLHRGDRWLLYYAAQDAGSGRHCLSVATSEAPSGPFVDGSTQPLVCDVDLGGAIDPSPFVAPDGRAYLLWKAEGETIGGAPQLRSQELRDDGLALTGGPGVLLAGTQGWEGWTIEAPSMMFTAAGFTLLYSGNSWDRSGYGTGAALCDGPVGPCHRLPGPVLASSGDIVGPGGAEMFRDGGGALRVAFHAWSGPNVGYPYPRFLHIGTVRASGGQVAVSG